MPAINMGGDTVVVANPSTGHAVMQSPFSGPKGSPFDAKKYPANIYQPKLTDLVADPTNYSTGALSTGIGFGLDTRIAGINAPLYDRLIPASVNNPILAYEPGKTLPNNTAATDARLTAIGGGKSTANTVATPSVPAPYLVQDIQAWGNGGSRDAGAGPAFTGFGMFLGTATAATANGAAIGATGTKNRSGVTIPLGLSQFGSNDSASNAVT